MKKLIVILFTLALFGCVSNKEVKLEQVDESVLNNFTYEESEKDGIVYMINDDKYCLIVFKNLGIDPENVKLIQEESNHIIDIGEIEEVEKPVRYVFKYTYGEDLQDEDATMIVSDGETEYPFEGVYTFN